jgi:diguanylate cyclase (GGDEF)-like protein
MAGSIPGADAAMIVLRPAGRGRDPLVASVGMSTGETGGRLAELPEGVRTTIVSYRYSDAAEPARHPLRGGFVVPLVAEERRIGSLAVFWRSERQPEERDIAVLEELAQRTAAATRNAERFAQGRELVSRDVLTGFGNRRFLEDALAREVPRAHRYGHPLTVLMAGIEGLGGVGDRSRAPGTAAPLAELAGGIRGTVRDSDVTCYLGGDEFAVVMPESLPDGAVALASRLRKAIRAPLPTLGGLDLTAGVAQLHRDETPQRLLERAGEALSQARQSGRGGGGIGGWTSSP